MGRAIRFITAAFVGLACLSTTSSQAAPLKRYETRYYIIYSDLDEAVVREAEHRVCSMAEEYHARTQGFAGQIAKKLPFYLFSEPKDYYAAGGLPGSAGVFNGEKLMAIGNADLGLDVWHVVQHEGFHQFLHAVVGGDIPIWMNEGLAEYFGEGVFTGDGYVMGIIPAQRAARVKAMIQQGRSLSIQQMMQVQHEAWNNHMSIENYDQAWSMVYFLAHGKSGAYQDEFNRFLQLVSRGDPWVEAWAAAFGRGTREFEQQWKEFWLEQPAEPTPELVVRSCVATLTSFYARAFSQKQYFETAEAFFQAAEAGKLKSNAQDWLPPALLQRELKRCKKLGEWRVAKRGSKWELRCETDWGLGLAGQFQVTSNGRVKDGSIKVVALKEKERSGR
ncbi:MAG: DUF1570 domain-containing protein [Planctomycetes bacterium]|nr:DUF1570 domain-containing protein [Planctomycetota bacterium]